MWEGNEIQTLSCRTDFCDKLKKHQEENKACIVLTWKKFLFYSEVADIFTCYRCKSSQED